MRELISWLRLLCVKVEGSIRKKDDRRKRQREAKAERKAAEKGEAADDLKRLKNIKKKELNTK